MEEARASRISSKANSESERAGKGSHLPRIALDSTTSPRVDLNADFALSRPLEPLPQPPHLRLVSTRAALEPATEDPLRGKMAEYDSLPARQARTRGYSDDPGERLYSYNSLSSSLARNRTRMRLALASAGPVVLDEMNASTENNCARRQRSSIPSAKARADHSPHLAFALQPRVRSLHLCSHLLAG